MNSETGGNRLLRPAGGLAVVAAVALLTACSGGPSSSAGSASTGTTTYGADLAYAQCMRAHGLTKFPDPGNSGFSVNVTVSPNSPAARARDACKHLLPSGGATKDMAGFDSRFGLPPARIHVNTTLAGSSASPWLELHRVAARPPHQVLSGSLGL